MAIRKTTFGAVELTGKDATRMLRHMVEDKPCQQANESLERGRDMLRTIQNQTRKRRAANIKD